MVVSIFTFSEANISKYFVSNLFEQNTDDIGQK